jgi:hypothetical protein
MPFEAIAKRQTLGKTLLAIRGLGYFYGRVAKIKVPEGLQIMLRCTILAPG